MRLAVVAKSEKRKIVWSRCRVQVERGAEKGKQIERGTETNREREREKRDFFCKSQKKKYYSKLSFNFVLRKCLDFDDGQREGLLATLRSTRR